MNKDMFSYGTGKRKNAIARTRIFAGTGQILVNDRPFTEYFTRAALQLIIKQPLVITGNVDRFDIRVLVDGGGISGQADAVRHGISRALLAYDENLRPTLKSAGFLTRDSRKKERKKYGQRGARARFQFSKR